MSIKVIKNEADYVRALARADELMDAEAGTPEADELEVLVTLIELYEEKTHPIDLPDPLEAIRFRMEQAGLKQRDLAPLLGGRSRVSEVLSGKRPLSIRMMRALHTKLGIPAEVLLQEPRPERTWQNDIRWEKFPAVEMARRGWLPGLRKSSRRGAEPAADALRSFFRRPASYDPAPAFLRQHIRSGSKMDEYALAAWRVRVLQLASGQNVEAFSAERLAAGLSTLAQLSYLSDGPRLAREYLAKSGVALVVLEHLPRTHLDGGALCSPEGRPVVALTLRHDRLDNFWFTLFHELGHVVLHLAAADHPTVFVDDLSPEPGELDEMEKEADRFAAVNLIPEKDWQDFYKKEDISSKDVEALADRLRISPAIVAGRIRRETGNYRRFSNLVGQGEVRKLFSNRQGALSAAGG